MAITCGQTPRPLWFILYHCHVSHESFSLFACCHVVRLVIYIISLSCESWVIQSVRMLSCCSIASSPWMYQLLFQFQRKLQVANSQKKPCHRTQRLRKGSACWRSTRRGTATSTTRSTSVETLETNCLQHLALMLQSAYGRESSIHGENVWKHALSSGLFGTKLLPWYGMIKLNDLAIEYLWQIWCHLITNN